MTIKFINGIEYALTAEELAEEQALEEAEEARIIAELPNDIRAGRDRLLAKTDWMSGSDVTMSDEWRTYRQALRDIPSQSGFPNTITWPVEPS
tara:strand:+ start:1193 stop:1471 length:279 start_codon:yes stop_codon:yes gene_type:complete